MTEAGIPGPWKRSSNGGPVGSERGRVANWPQARDGGEAEKHSLVWCDA